MHIFRHTKSRATPCRMLRNYQVHLLVFTDAIDKKLTYYSAVFTQTRLPSKVIAIFRMSVTPAA